MRIRNNINVEKEVQKRRRVVKRIIKEVLNPANFTDDTLNPEIVKSTNEDIKYLQTVMCEKDIKFLSNLVNSKNPVEAFNTISLACVSNTITSFMRDRLESCVMYMEHAIKSTYKGVQVKEERSTV